MSAHKDSSSLRYFLAGLRPLGRPLFWLPMGLLSLILLGYWQYEQNPRWLGINPSSPTISIENEIPEVPPEIANPSAADAENLPPLPYSSRAKDLSRSNRSPSDSGESQETATTLDPLAPFTGNTNQKDRKSSLFLPLLPTVKRTPAPSTVRGLQPLQVAPPAGNDDNYPLQRALENSARNSSNYPNNSPSGLDAGGNNRAPAPAPAMPNYQPAVPPATTYQPYGNAPVPGQGIDRVPTLGTQPNPTGYPNQGAPPVYGNSNPYPAPSQTQTDIQTRGYSIQPPIDARPSGY